MSPIISPSGGGGGGSQPNGWQLADFLFTEQNVAGVISTDVALPTGGWPLGFFLRGIADWFDDTASSKIADDLGTTYYQSENAFATDKDGGWFQTASPGAPTNVMASALFAHLTGARTVTLSYTTTVADPAPTGQTRIGLIYALGDAQIAVP